MKNFKNEDRKKQQSVTDASEEVSFRANKKTFEKRFENLPEQEKILTRSLFELLNMRRLKKNRDMRCNPSTIPGVMALHVTAWDWLFLNVKMKNTSRDIMPLVRAITLERSIVKKYRPSLLKEPSIGALRRSLEDTLRACTKERQTIGASGRLVYIQEWTWWDGVELSGDVLTAKGILEKLNADDVRKQQQQGERLALEDMDRLAITRVVNLVSGLSCAKATTEGDNVLSMDVVTPLKRLVYVSVLSLFIQIQPAHGTGMCMFITLMMIPANNTVACAAHHTINTDKSIHRHKSVHETVS